MRIGILIVDQRWAARKIKLSQWPHQINQMATHKSTPMISATSLVFFYRISAQVARQSLTILLLFLSYLLRSPSSFSIASTCFSSIFSLPMSISLSLLIYSSLIFFYLTEVSSLISFNVFLDINFLSSSKAFLQCSANSTSLALSQLYQSPNLSTLSLSTFKLSWFMKYTLFLPNYLQVNLPSSVSSFRMLSKTAFFILPCRLSNTFNKLQGLFCFCIQSKTTYFDSLSPIVSFPLLSFFFLGCLTLAFPPFSFLSAFPFSFFGLESDALLALSFEVDLFSFFEDFQGSKSDSVSLIFVNKIKSLSQNG